ncbi:MAG TPA: hypothetical protein VFZ70_07630 [Euzebyales bacterium]
MTDQRMRRSTAVGQVEGMVDAASDIHRLNSHGLDIPLLEVWVGGAILEPVDRIDSSTSRSCSTYRPTRAPGARDPAGDWIADRVRLTKLPVAWVRATRGRPAYDRRMRRMIRVWSTSGTDRDAIDRLRHGDPTLGDAAVPVDTEQLATELAEFRRHLATVLDSCHDRDWRREHTGGWIHPEDHLWRAAQAVRELTDAIEERRAGEQ